MYAIDKIFYNIIYNIENQVLWSLSQDLLWGNFFLKNASTKPAREYMQDAFILYAA